MIDFLPYISRLRFFIVCFTFRLLFCYGLSGALPANLWEYGVRVLPSMVSFAFLVSNGSTSVVPGAVKHILG